MLYLTRSIILIVGSYIIYLLGNHLITIWKIFPSSEQVQVTRTKWRCSEVQYSNDVKISLHDTCVLTTIMIHFASWPKLVLGQIGKKMCNFLFLDININLWTKHERLKQFRIRTLSNSIRCRNHPIFVPKEPYDLVLVSALILFTLDIVLMWPKLT